MDMIERAESAWTDERFNPGSGPAVFSGSRLRW